MRKSIESEIGRLGEILQLGLYFRLGVKFIDLADRTEKRAPLLYSCEAIVASPDADAMRTGRFWMEFKSKRKHQKWGGGSKDDKPRYAPRKEHGIDTRGLLNYREAERQWKQPVVLSVLCINDAEIRAATLDQLSEPRYSNHPAWPMANWSLRDFNRIATFDPRRLRAFFDSKEARSIEGKTRWIKHMPQMDEISHILDWLKTSQGEFDIVRQFIFDQIEREWKN